ncbi:MAG TPA: 3-phosphoshikimate 1-carboxyvinyltransferase [Thermoanaerobaculia bacterium]|nr:3-phosphoshikimate 1-carboxyvinyltransferase [Thermoanaerobaculia bacterium]
MTGSSLTWSEKAVTVPSGGIVSGRLRVPPSKSYTLRYLNLALLAARPVEVRHPLAADDPERFLAALETLGWSVERGDEAVRLAPPVEPVDEAMIDCGDCGTMFRLLAASLTTLPGRFTLGGSSRLMERPIAPLVEALQRLGARVESGEDHGRGPLRIEGPSLGGGRTAIDAGESSQFLSAVLMAGSRATESVEIEVASLASAPYVDVTLDAIERFGGRVEVLGTGRYRVHPGLAGTDSIEVPGDDSAAAYPAAAAALTGGDVVLEGLDPDSAQGDRRFLDLLREMGANVERSGGGRHITVHGTGRLAAVDADLSEIPDQVPTLAALAPFARGTTRIRNVAHLRLKESDRLAAMAAELMRLGACVGQLDDGLEIEGTFASGEIPTDPVTVDPHGDHRIAMSLALVGLRRPGVTIMNPSVVSKSYPQFWSDLDRILGR